MSEIRELLEEARTRLGRGWGQKAYYNLLTGNYCISGAVIYSGKSRSYLTVSAALARLLPLIPDQAHGLVAWNDEPGRTQAEVLAVLDRAIAAEKKKETP